MEDLVLCYDNGPEECFLYAESMYKSLQIILEIGVREPNRTDKTTFMPSAANLVLIITPNVIENPIVMQTLEKAAQTKRNIIFLEDLGRPDATWKHELEKIEDEGLVKKLNLYGKTLKYTLDCTTECNDELLKVMKFSEDAVMATIDVRKQAVVDDILRYSAKVSKLRIKAQQKRRVDFCITAANPSLGPNGEKLVLDLASIFKKRAPALCVACNRGDKSTASASIREGNIQDSFNLVVCVTTEGLTCPDLLGEIRYALEADVKITLVHYLAEVANLAEMIANLDDPVLKSHVARIVPYPYMDGYGENVVRALVAPDCVKVDDVRTPRTRQSAIPVFRLGYKNALSLDMPTDGRLHIYKTKKEEEGKSIPNEIMDMIKDLWKVYDPTESGKITWDEFTSVDRLVVESVGGNYSEMISRRIYSMMLYPGLTLDEKVSFQTFQNYYEFLAKNMGCNSGDGDVQIHFKYVVDKVKSMMKRERHKKKYDMVITHDRSKPSAKFCVDLFNAIREFTPNVRCGATTEKNRTPLDMVASTLNIVVLLSKKVFKSEAVQEELKVAAENGAKVLLVSNVETAEDFIANLSNIGSPELESILARPAVVPFHQEWAGASANGLLDNLHFPAAAGVMGGAESSGRPTRITETSFRRRENPLALFLYQKCSEPEEVANVFACLANCTSAVAMNGSEIRKVFLRDGGVDILVNRFRDLSSMGPVAEAGLRATAYLAQEPEVARKLAELGHVETVIAALESHSDNPLIGGEACRAIANMGSDEEAKLRINRQNGFQKVLAVTKRWALEQETSFLEARFAFKRLNVGDPVMVFFTRGVNIWCSAIVIQANSNGTYDLECAHGSIERKVPAQWVRPKTDADKVAEFAAVWQWKPTGKLTEDEMVLKSDGLVQLRSGAMGTWSVPKDSKEKRRSSIKVQLHGGAGLEIKMERISITMLRSTTTAHRAVLKETFQDCISAEYWNFANAANWLDRGIPPLLGKKPDVSRAELLVNYEPQKGDAQWVGLPECLKENFCAIWSGYIEIEKGGEYTFYVEAENHARLLIDDSRVIDLVGEGKALAGAEASITLIPGQRSLQLEYAYKAGGSKACILSYKGRDTDDEKRLVPAAIMMHKAAKTAKVKKPGVFAMYYAGTADLVGEADVTRVEKQIDFQSTSDPWENLPLRYGGSQAWSARFCMYIRLQCGGNKKAKYTFHIDSGKKGTLYCNGELLSSEDEPKELEFTPGEYLLEVEYRTTGGPNGLCFYYAGPETSPGNDEEGNPLPPLEVTVPSTVTRHYIVPAVALPKGNPIQASGTGGGKAVALVAVDWASDDSFFVTADADGSIKMWNPVDGSQQGSTLECQMWVRSAVIGSGTTYATGLSDGKIMLWDLRRGEEIGSAMEGHAEGKAVTGLAMSLDGKTLASCCEDGTVRFWDLDSQQEKTDPEDPLTVYKRAEFNKKKPYDAPCGKVSTLNLGADGTYVEVPLKSCSFSLDGKLLAVGGEDNLLRLIYVPELDFVRKPDIKVEIPVEVDEDADPEASDAEPPEPQFEFKPGEPYFIVGHSDVVSCVSFAPKAYEDPAKYMLASTSDDATVRIWIVNVEHRSDNNGVEDHISPIQCLGNFVRWSPDGATIATASESSFFQLWSSVSGNARNADALAGHMSSVVNAAFAPFGQACVSASEDGTVRVWHFLVNRNIVAIADLEKKQMVLNQEMISWEQKLAEIKRDYKNFDDGATLYKKDVVWLHERLASGKERAAEYNLAEQLLGLDLTDYYELDGLMDEYTPYHKLWNTVIMFQEGIQDWENVPIHTVPAGDVEARLDVWFRMALQMIKDVPNKGGFDSPYTKEPKKVTVRLRDSIDAFRKRFPFLRAFSQSYILDRHWDELFKKMSLEKAPCAYKDITGRIMMDLGVLDFEEEYEGLSAGAMKENSLKLLLKSMKEAWEPVEFETVEYKNTGAIMLRGIDDVQTILDDHIVKTQGIRSSPYCAPFAEEVHVWEAKLTYLQDFVDQTLLVQRTWMSLEPIFISDDIKRQLPVESAAFVVVDETFRQRMKQVASDTHGLAIAAIPNLVEDMTAANLSLEKIQKGLKDYLETKRLYFPRFFFLNDADLLSILAETKDPTLVQPHMGKCWEGIQKVRFDSTDSIIDAMVSPEGELVPWYTTCDVNSPENKGNVEKWLLLVEEIAYDTLRDLGNKSNKDYSSKPRPEWCLDWQGQIVLLTDVIFWTTETQQALTDKKVKEHLDHLKAQLTDIVFLVRGEMTKNARVAVGAMVTLDVHNRDVVEEFVDNKVDSPDAFDYLSQLRYYWQQPGACILKTTGEPNEKLECNVSIVNSTLLYGFEYLGNTARLVVTPLTDRCYRTLMGAFALYYGGAPEGPAGTGKTESTKDLAKALAICCVVFNCSDSMDYLQLAKFFKGLASSGSWCCFDEFNRISLEVLSVVAQQIQQISFAIKQHLKKFVFEDTEIRLVPTCAVNITMNPGYAGRSELPDNLKALFRPVAMMVPNYALIAEIRLYSFGYVDARRIGLKGTQALKLSSEQLSPQRHYDFGMRGLNALLVAGGNGKRQYGDQYAEDVVALRSFMDVNMPKFTSADIPLFKGIIGDLFPGVETLPSDYGVFLEKVELVTIQRGLQPAKPFFDKVIQLWETIMVRHGLMTVGMPPCAKTMVKDVLAETLSLVADGGDVFMPVTQYVMNPKSITQGQLYGEADLNTQEWTDGVLAIAVRSAATAYGDGRRQWVVLDGPVDAIWIENMNTVLDDNKKLCLNSGEIIKLSLVTTMLFEVRDLDYASPATVSRVGIVFFEPNTDLGWRPLVRSWLDNLPKFVLDEHRSLIENLFFNQFEVFMEIAERCTTPVQISKNWLTLMALRLMKSLILDETERYIRPNPKNDDDEDGQTFDDREIALVQLFYFTVTWTCGACSNAAGREQFTKALKAITSGRKDQIADLQLICDHDSVALEGQGTLPDLPRSNLPHDIYVDKDDGFKWALWTERIGTVDIAKDAQFHQIIVPTADTVRNQFLLRTLVESNNHVLISGPTGTAKTASINGMLLGGFSPEHYTTNSFAFSAKTTANQTQDIIDGKLEKRKKGVFGPPINKKFLIFIDDLNMPAKEEYGAQPPIEILRQAFVTTPHGLGWYDRRTWDFRNLIEMVFLTAMGPPGAGKNDITDRYSVCFNLIFVTEFDEESLNRIFSTSVGKFFASMARDVAGQVPAVVEAVLAVYSTVQKDLLPTPAKSHYTFNMRDVSKVFQGMCACTRESIPKIDDLVRCWMHESERIFKDRLINDADGRWFNNLLKRLMDKVFKRAYDQIMRNEVLIFTDFVDPKSKIIQEVVELPKLLDKLTECLEEFNSMAKVRMDLVLFWTFIQHICRVIRVLRLPLGNALLVGVGGSGRKSATTLATYVADYKLFQIEIAKGYGMNEWHDDMRSLLMGSGYGTITVFLFPDTQIANETFLEEVSSILNTGEVPNLYGSEEKMEILEKVSKPANLAGKHTAAEIFAFYVEVCRKNTHIVLAMSPIGSMFRNRLRSFPSLVNCCTIDWFMNWPKDALKAVAEQFLAKVEMEDSIRDSVVAIKVDCQMIVTDLTEKYLQEQKRYFYVTPSSYLELINSFMTMLKQERHSVKQAKWRYEVGLEKIANAQGEVATLQKELEDLQPILEVSAKETSEMMVKVEAEQAAAEEKQTLVDEEAAKANEQASAASIIKADCEKDLSAALPALEAATDAVSKLSKGDLVEMRGMKVPTPGVYLVATAMCHMFQVKPIKVAAPDGKGKVDDFWEPCKKDLLGDTGLIKRMIDFDKDNMPEVVVNKVTPVFNKEEFEPDLVKKSSIAAMGICKWIRAMVIYDKIVKEVGPKKLKLAEAEKTAETALALVATKKAELAHVIALVDKLMSELKEAKDKMADLQKTRDDCAGKLVRADKLLSGLASEQVNWKNKAKRLGLDYENLVGDILIACGIIAYLGVFTSQYRSQATAAWLAKLQHLKVPARKNFSLPDVIGDQVKIRAWIINKLPNDALSIDNGIILDNSRRWPLMIDPQNQANKWVKTTHKEQLKIFRLTQNYTRALEFAITMGCPSLIENVGEELDPILDPLLQKAIFKEGPVEKIKFGDAAIDYSRDFQLYITTKLANPHYGPEICVAVGLLNFMATLDGLQDQQLGILVAMEEPEVEQKRQNLVIESAQAKAQLKQIEDRILAMLSAATGNILDDEDLIETLANSKIMAVKIEEQVQQQERTGVQIAETRAVYRPLAIRCACLYFIVGILTFVDPMYQFSLDWFIEQFSVAIARADSAEDREGRFENLFRSYITLLYKLVCRSLFEKDKLLYSMMLTFKVQEIDKELDMPAMTALFTGLPGVNHEERPENSEWLTDSSWLRIKNLQKLGGTFDGFIEAFKNKISGWQEVFDCDEPLDVEWPDQMKEKCKPLERALMLFALRTDQTVPAIQGIVEDKLGREFLEVPPFDLPGAFEDSLPWIPIIFVLSTGSDPMGDITKLSESIIHSDGSKMISKIQPISLGQGQGPKAVAGIKEGAQVGKWVLLQNCHLAVSWMPTLEGLVDALSRDAVDKPTDGQTQKFFRLWLTAMPSPAFPISVLQNGVKLTIEPPKGLRNSLMRQYAGMDEDWYETCTKPIEFQKILFGLSFFHALILERRKFGAIGWNVPYGFSEPDGDISRRQLKQFLDEYSFVPWEALRYMVAEANYGGRVTDGQDRRAIVQILEDFYTPEVLNDDYKFSISGKYFAPLYGPISSQLDYIRSMPLNQMPEVFWLHSNANLTAAINEASAILLNAINMISAFGGGGGGDDDEEGDKKAKPASPDQVYSDLAADFCNRMPKMFDMKRVEVKYPVDYDECLNTVLMMELGKFNRLINKIGSTMADLQKAVKGLVVLSPELEECGTALLANKVPAPWFTVSYPCLKPLQSYFQDFLDRCSFLQTWINNGAPYVFWFSCFFFQQAYLTGVLQNFARRDKIAIDRCLWNYKTCKIADSNPTEPANPGSYCNGMSMDGARWDDDLGHIVDSFPKVLWAAHPNIWLKPVELQNDKQTDRAKINSGSRDHVYACPVYKESLRRGVLSTSGHSSNFIMWLYMDIHPDHTEQLWTKRGVALITMTDD